MDHNRKKDYTKNTTPSLIAKIGQPLGDKIPPKKVASLNLSDEEIREISKSWSPDDWEAYLSTMNVRTEETLLEEPISIEEISNENGPAEIFSMIHEEHPEKRQRLELSVRKIMRQHLSKREYQVMWLRYWEELSQREIAKRLNVSRRTIRICLDRGHKKFKTAVLLRALKRSRNLSSL